MAKFWKVIKVIIFIWGALSLGTILAAILYVNISERLTTKIAPMEKDEVYEKSSGDLKLTATTSAKDSSKVVLDLKKANTQLVKNFALPLKKYRLDSLEINNSDIIPINNNEYRIILYGSSGDDSESSGGSVWFLKYENQMKVVEVVDLGGMLRTNDVDRVLLGYKDVGLPYQDGFEYVHFQIPIEVRFDNSIQRLPLLTPDAIRVIRKLFDEEAQKRMDKLRTAGAKDKDADATLALIKDSLKDFSDAVAEKSVDY